MRTWLEANCSLDDSTVYIGYEPNETQRRVGGLGAWAPWSVEYPLFEEPHIPKADLLAMALGRGLRPPRLYHLGFPHNNCGGFCVKAGHAQFNLLLKTFPARYLFHEWQEARCRTLLGKDVAILRDRRGGETRPLTMREFRLQQEFRCG